jgi:hypothetical protein
VVSTLRSAIPCGTAQSTLCFKGNLELRGEGSLEIPIRTQGDAPYDNCLCNLTINVAGTLTMYNDTHIHAPLVSVAANVRACL